jgi:pyroglutamyl-peptidase
MNVLLTGFEPFGSWREGGINPSQRVVEALAAAPPPHLTLRTAVLPVAFAGAGPLLRALIDEHDPAAIVLLGQGGGAALRVERVGLNFQDIPGRYDNAGETREEQPIDRDGPAAYFATIPVRALVRRLNAEGVPAVESLSAGAYLCNHVLYVARRHCEQTHRSAPVGFIHLPLLPEQAAAEPGRERPPSMALDTQVRGIRRALAFVAEAAASGVSSPGGHVH